MGEGGEVILSSELCSHLYCCSSADEGQHTYVRTWPKCAIKNLPTQVILFRLMRYIHTCTYTSVNPNVLGDIDPNVLGDIDPHMPTRHVM